MKTSKFSRYKIRIREILSRRGWKGLARFLFERFVWRQWRSIILRDPIGARRLPSCYADGIRFSYWLSRSSIPEEVSRLLSAAGGREFAAELEDRDGIWVLQDVAGNIVGWGGIYHDARQARVLALPPAAVLLGGGVIVPACRGKGLHRLAVNDVALRLAQRGYKEVFTEVHPDNIASLRGLEGAQFVRVREVCLRILFRRVVFDHNGVRWV
ncbi:MAG: GNAT family N-acetyltransferase [Acidobacteriota bacterium]